MIQALVCLLFPFAGHCSAYVSAAPAIRQVVAAPKRYNGEFVVMTGRVRKLDQWRSKNGNDEEVFYICENGCVRVYMRQHSPVRNGQRITVSGPFYAAYHVGRSTFRNEIEATRVLARE